MAFRKSDFNRFFTKGLADLNLINITSFIDPRGYPGRRTIVLKDEGHDWRSEIYKD